MTQTNPNSNENAKNAFTGLQSYVTTPIANNMNYPKLATAVLGSYVVLEVINHVVLGGYIMPYLVTSLGLGATTAGIIMYGALAASALGISYLVYKMFFNKPKQVATKPLNDGAVYIPVSAQ